MKFGSVSIKSASASAYSNNFRNGILFEEMLYGKDVSMKSIEDALKNAEVSKYGQPLRIYSYRPDSRYCYAGLVSNGKVCPSLRITWEGLDAISEDSYLAADPIRDK